MSANQPEHRAALEALLARYQDPTDDLADDPSAMRMRAASGVTERQMRSILATTIRLNLDGLDAMAEQWLVLAGVVAAQDPTNPEHTHLVAEHASPLMTVLAVQEGMINADPFGVVGMALFQSIQEGYANNLSMDLIHTGRWGVGRTRLLIQACKGL